MALATAFSIVLAALAARAEPSAMQRKAADAFAAGDLDTAVAAYGECTRAGEAACQSFLGVLFLMGNGVDQDRGKAAALFEKAAGQGDSMGEFYLGFMLRRGIAMDPDPGRAIELLERAARGGYAPALAQLGQMNARGEGMPVDRIKAIMLLLEAGTQGLPDALLQAGLLILGKEGDDDRDPEAAFETILMAAGMDFAPAMMGVAEMLLAGEGTGVDTVEAMKWALLASRHRESDPELRAIAQAAIVRIDPRLSAAEREEARARAAAWTPSER